MKKVPFVALLVAATFAGGAPLSTVSAASTAAPAAQTTQAAPQAESGEKYIHFDLTPAEISKRIGFAVKLPGYLPKGDYLLAGIVYHSKQNTVSLSFMGLGTQSFYLAMQKGELAKEAAGLTKTELKQRAYVGKDGERNELLWEEEKGVLYRLSSALPVEELKKIAETMGQGDYDKMKKAVPMKEEGEKILNPSLEEASKKIGFPIKMPTVLPKGVELRVFAYEEFRGVPEVTLVNKENGPTIPDIFIYLKKGDINEEKRGVEGVEKIPFGGGFALAYKVPVSSINKPHLTEINGFTWSPAEGIVYSLHSDLPYEEIKKIAESVK